MGYNNHAMHTVMVWYVDRYKSNVSISYAHRENDGFPLQLPTFFFF